MAFTDIKKIPEICLRVRNAFNAGKTRPVSWRKEQLRSLLRLVNENRQLFYEAGQKDLHKHPFEVDAHCLAMIESECVHLLNHLDEYVLPERPPVPFVNAFDGAQIRNEPLGAVLVIGAWNYPFSLTICPAAGAIAAGNSVVLKPSELAGHSAELMAKLITQYLDNEAISVVLGGAQETQALLDQRWDHIFYTGGTAVGKIIYEKAAQQLCPVTLELGGKSPCIVDDDCNLPVAARRIAWGRWINSGQTCIAPDYILTTRQTAERLIPELQKAVTEYYGQNPKTSESYARIINPRHHARLTKLIDRKKVAFGGEVDESDLFIAPTVLNDVRLEDPIMQEEIFGPLLPIVHVRSLDEAIDVVNQKPRPLALYVFTNSKARAEEVLNRTNSGGALVNDTIMHISCPALPFGGVGNSGMGAYHGKYSFDTFTHKRGTMVKDLSLEAVNGIRYPPYTMNKLGWIRYLVMQKEGGKNVIGRVFNAIPWNIVGPVALAALAYQTGCGAFSS
jgi:acyl-CoA reductase-like NAD-dependent aldehyde dehydrogenase